MIWAQIAGFIVWFSKKKRNGKHIKGLIWSSLISKYIVDTEYEKVLRSAAHKPTQRWVEAAGKKPYTCEKGIQVTNCHVHRFYGNRTYVNSLRENANLHCLGKWPSKIVQWSTVAVY